MTQFRFHAKRLFDGKNFIDDQVLTITDGFISAIDQNTNDVDIKSTGLVVPGYIDLQVNGGGGVLFNDSPSLDKLKTIIGAQNYYVGTRKIWHDSDDANLDYRQSRSHGASGRSNV